MKVGMSSDRRKIIESLQVLRSGMAEAISELFGFLSFDEVSLFQIFPCVFFSVLRKPRLVLGPGSVFEEMNGEGSGSWGFSS
jgi:hypothetical protein